MEGTATPSRRSFKRDLHRQTEETHHHDPNIDQLGIEVAVDFIFVSSDITVKHFAVIEEDLSDHLGLTVEVEI